MISKKLLKTYGFETKDQYFEMILESKINGQIKQAKEQLKKLSYSEKYHFLTYLQDISVSSDVYNFFYHNSYNGRAK